MPARQIIKTSCDLILVRQNGKVLQAGPIFLKKIGHTKEQQATILHKQARI